MVKADVVPFIKYLCESFHAMAQEKNINLTVYAEIEELVMDFDPSKFSTIVSNLVSNAIKFTQDGEKIIVHLNTTSSGGKEYFILKVIDNGEGLSKEEIPDIIICDVMMPGKDGFEVCVTLKADIRTDHIPIIILTAKATYKDRLTGLSYGADAYLTKPFSKAELLTRLDQLILLRKKMMKKLQEGSFNRFLKQWVENPETKFIQKAVKIIHQNIDNHMMGSAFFSQKLNLSESQLYRKLKAITGKSTAVFIRSVRLQMAKELIQTTDKLISEVAYEVGFNDPSWFSQAFKEEFGYAPSALSK